MTTFARAALAGCVFALVLTIAAFGDAALARPGRVSRATVERRDGLRLYRIVYASTGLRGEAIEVTGIVIVPDGPARHVCLGAMSHPARCFA